MADGIDYPAVLFTTFDTDTRVDPLHARKMCAALQHATTGARTRPILLRRETDVGHGARSVSRTVELAVDQLAFLAAHTGWACRCDSCPSRPSCAGDAGTLRPVLPADHSDLLARSADAIVAARCRSC